MILSEFKFCNKTNETGRYAIKFIYPFKSFYHIANSPFNNNNLQAFQLWIFNSFLFMNIIFLNCHKLFLNVFVNSRSSSFVSYKPWFCSSNVINVFMTCSKFYLRQRKLMTLIHKVTGLFLHTSSRKAAKNQWVFYKKYR